jgi:hypothetical protein
MLVAMPSSGSDWLSGCMLRAKPELRHPPVKEFWNPICNLAKYCELAQVFGCETIDTYRNIARIDSYEDIDNFLTLFDSIWHHDWQFTKEVWHGFHIFILSMRFNCVGLVRDAENTFPPQRLRVYQWYGAIVDSLIVNQRLESHYRHEHLIEKAYIGHKRLKDSITSELPAVICWEHLVSKDRGRVVESCRLLSDYIDPETLADSVMESARLRSR